MLKFTKINQENPSKISPDKRVKTFDEIYARYAAQKAEDPDVRKLLGDLAAIEGKHGDKATFKLSEIESSTVGNEEVKKDEKQFILTWVQPGLAGLMDGSVSTLAPIFATAFATKDSHTTLLVEIGRAHV